MKFTPHTPDYNNFFSNYLIKNPKLKYLFDNFLVFMLIMLLVGMFILIIFATNKTTNKKQQKN